jgi:radical SAM superfamily enzyme YgiQ (UPF0313 family)
MQLDLVLINPASRKAVYQSLGGSIAAVEPPVWLGLFATFVRRRGFSVLAIDAEAEELSAEDTAKRVAEMNPRLACVVVYGHQPSASTQNMPAAGAMCQALKAYAPESKVLLVGGHVAALPERTLREEAADFVCDGEGPYTLVDLLAALRANETDFKNVRGLCYSADGQIVRTASAPLVANVNEEMQGPAWDLLPMEKYRAHNWHCFGHLERQPYAALYTTLGCPYRCSFCCIQAPFKSGERLLGMSAETNSYRFWDPAVIAAEIDTLVNKYGVRNIKIADEMFVLNHRHVSGLCDVLIERNYNLNIWAYARVDTVKADLVDKLKRAGVNWLAFGIEAANERVRQDVQKGFDQQLVYDVLDRVRAAGINVIANYIFGLPEDDLSTMNETLQLALELNCEFANFYCATAYPGSPLYSLAIERGWRLPEKWSGYSQHSVDTLPLPTKYLSAGDVLRFRDRAFETYVTAPSYLEMVERKFGADTVAHLREVSSHRLVRLHA